MAIGIRLKRVHMGLQIYRAKRKFDETTEPAGTTKAGKRSVIGGSFVIQKHAASHLHYDFRLEMEGVLKSWAVPKGPPMKRGDRRLAVEVEDHPLDYGDFEGTIPEGNYGAGTVMVWDTGTYESLGGEPLEGLRDGKIHFALNGKKLRGEWTLVRMRERPGQSKPQWLLLKSGADLPEISPELDDESALTRRSMADIAAGRTRPSRRAAGTATPRAAKRRSAASKLSSSRSRRITKRA